ncbi:MAG: type II secretion system protein GspG [Spirochaetota bacterium]
MQKHIPRRGFTYAEIGVVVLIVATTMTLVFTNLDSIPEQAQQAGIEQRDQSSQVQKQRSQDPIARPPARPQQRPEPKQQTSESQNTQANNLSDEEEVKEPKQVDAPAPKLDKASKKRLKRIAKELETDAEHLLRYIRKYEGHYNTKISEKQGLLVLLQKPTGVDFKDTKFRVIAENKAHLYDPWGNMYVLVYALENELQIWTYGKDKQKNGSGQGLDKDFNILNPNTYPQVLRSL